MVELLEEYGIWEYPMSVNRVADALGIEVVGHSDLEAGVCALARAASDDAFSLTTYDYSTAKIVVDNRSSYFNRSRFSRAHELGHIWLGHPSGGWPYEAEADYFAGYLLAPHPLVLNTSDATTIARRFDVSEQSATVAIAQARRRFRESTPWRSHEVLIRRKVQWKGGGLLGRA